MTDFLKKICVRGFELFFIAVVYKIQLIPEWNGLFRQIEM
jgi:hypothetical protein